MLVDQRKRGKLRDSKTYGRQVPVVEAGQQTGVASGGEAMTKVGAMGAFHDAHHMCKCTPVKREFSVPRLWLNTDPHLSLVDSFPPS